MTKGTGWRLETPKKSQRNGHVACSSPSPSSHPATAFAPSTSPTCTRSTTPTQRHGSPAKCARLSRTAASSLKDAQQEASSLYQRKRPCSQSWLREARHGLGCHCQRPHPQEQNRHSTDLRNRFRNAFAELYQAARYKPHNSSEKRNDDGVLLPMRAATDDQLTSSSGSHIGPTRMKRASRQGFLRGGTKSLPESVTCSEEESSGAEDPTQSPL